MCEMMRSLNELNWIKIYVDNVSHISYLITQLTRFSITWATFRSGENALLRERECQWNEMRHLPSISSDFRPLPGLTGHTRYRKTNKRRNTTGSVSARQYFIQSGHFFYQIAVNEREGGNSGNISTFTANYSKGNQELWYIVGYLLMKIFI